MYYPPMYYPNSLQVLQESLSWTLIGLSALCSQSGQDLLQGPAKTILNVF